MLTVYIWKYRGSKTAWGHASLLVDQTYMSWWPEPEDRISSKVHPNIYTVGAIRARSFDDDVRDEDDLQPDHAIQLHGLDENAIKDWWQSFGLVRDGVLYQGPLLPWETLKLNCAAVTAHGLTIGGGRKFASWNKYWSVVWTPNQTYQYAMAIQEGLARRRAKL